jgi:hypothetical protein
MTVFVRDPSRAARSAFGGGARLLLAGAATLLLAGCATPFAPVDDPAVPAQTAIQTKQLPEAAVSTAVLTDAEARERFGVDLGNRGLQAVWLRIENRTTELMWFQVPALDLDYYSADEVAYLCRGDVPGAQYEAMRQHLRDQSMRVRLEPGTIEEGHVFVPRAVGGRYVNVELGLPGRRVVAGFPVRLPDGDFDFENLRPEAHYAGTTLPDLDADGLRRRLEQLPCCTTDASGDGQGDPLNLVLVGSAGDVLTALSRAGWTFTHRINLRTVRKEIGAAIAGSAYPSAPVSSLYTLGRKHDVAMQRGRQTISQRNHLRLWLAPFTYEGRPVWIGQVSRDIGVKLTTKSATLTTHVIDPEIDESRQYVLQGLLARGLVVQFAYTAGVGAAPRDAPRRNLTDDPYFTDGLRLVAVLSPDPVPHSAVVRLDWEDEPGPVATGQSERRRRPRTP